MGGWASAFEQRAVKAAPVVALTGRITPAKVDWKHLVVIDFETFYDTDYTLRKLSTSEYIRDPRFYAQMMGIKVGTTRRKVIPHGEIKSVLKSIDWKTHSLLCHHTAFDGFILHHHYKVRPLKYYDTLSMARGLHKNDIGASLDEVAQYYGVGNKIANVLASAKGIKVLPATLYKSMAQYCGVDVDLCLDIFKLMLAQMPDSEIELINRTIAMFCDPVLRVDIPRVVAEHSKEVEHKKKLLLSFIDPSTALTKGSEYALEQARKLIAGGASFADMLEKQGVAPPVKISPTTGKTVYAFAKTDIEFTGLAEHPKKRVRELVECRLGIKSSITETRAARFIEAGKNGMPLPNLLIYAAAHTLRFGGGNKMNLQNLTRGGELRKSILAPPGHMLVIGDSGQIEARMTAWLAGDDELLNEFRASDSKIDRDVYCKFGDTIYGRVITKKDEIERFVAKVAVLGLGFGMGAPKFQATLAMGTMGPPVFLELDECQRIVSAYRKKNHRIAAFWRYCQTVILPGMLTGTPGSHRCLSWEKERIWLPNGMALKYPGLRMHTDPDNEGFKEWTYLRQGSPVKIYGGLLCLGGNTEVLTFLGWKKLVDVRLGDALWDGDEWVNHEGVVLQGHKATINFGGVAMTPDHQVLVNGTWIEAQHTTYDEATSSSARHHGLPSRHAARGASPWQRWKANALGVAVRLWQRACAFSKRIPQRQHQDVRMFNIQPDLEVAHNARHVPSPSVRSVALNARSLSASHTSGMEELRRSRHHSVQALGEVRSVLDRHGPDICAGSDPRPDEQRGRVQQRQLPLGHLHGASQQPPQAVYDILNAGPRRRFTVRGADGRDFIVHNCENLSQALARIAVTEQWLKTPDRVVMMSHDELVLAVPKAKAKAAYERLMKTMSTSPIWAPDLPLTSEGGYDTFYSK